jgi:hypothetical protein
MADRSEQCLPVPDPVVPGRPRGGRGVATLAPRPDLRRRPDGSPRRLRSSVRTPRDRVFQRHDRVPGGENGGCRAEYTPGLGVSARRRHSVYGPAVRRTSDATPHPERTSETHPGPDASDPGPRYTRRTHCTRRGRHSERAPTRTTPVPARRVSPLTVRCARGWNGRPSLRPRSDTATVDVPVFVDG